MTLFLLVKGLKIAMVCQSVNVVEAYFFFDDRADEGIVRRLSATKNMRMNATTNI